MKKPLAVERWAEMSRKEFKTNKGKTLTNTIYIFAMGFLYGRFNLVIEAALVTVLTIGINYAVYAQNHYEQEEWR